jgi:hypothetical protein
MLDENNNYCAQKGEIHESKNIKTPFFSPENMTEKKRKNGEKIIIGYYYFYMNTATSLIDVKSLQV